MIFIEKQEEVKEAIQNQPDSIHDQSEPDEILDRSLDMHGVVTSGSFFARNHIEDKDKLHHMILKKYHKSNPTPESTIKLDDFTSMYASEVQKASNSYTQMLSALHKVMKTKKGLEHPVEKYPFYDSKSMISKITVNIHEVKSGKMRNELIGTYSFLDKDFIEKSILFLQLNNSSNFHMWDYKIETRIRPENDTIYVEVFNFADENSLEKSENSKEEGRSDKIDANDDVHVRMMKYAYKGKIELSLAEILVSHILENTYQGDKIITDDSALIASAKNGNNQAERPSIKTSGVIKILADLKLGVDFKDRLDEAILEKLIELNKDIGKIILVTLNSLTYIHSQTNC